MAANTMRIAVTFHTTTDAMHMESAAKADGLQGRLSPIPRQLSAGCGLCWMEPADNREQLCACIEKHHVEIAALSEVQDRTVLKRRSKTVQH